MRSLLRSASGVVLVLGLSAGAIADARADTEYKNFGELFDAILSGDHTGRIDRNIGRCSGSYGCSDNDPRDFDRIDRRDRSDASDRGGDDDDTDSGPERGGGDGDDGDGSDGDEGGGGGDGDGGAGGGGGDGDGSDGDGGYGDGGYGHGDHHSNDRGKGRCSLGGSGDRGRSRIRDSANAIAVDFRATNLFSNDRDKSNGLVKACAEINADGTIAACWRCNTDALETQRLATGSHEVDFTPLATDTNGRPRAAAITGMVCSPGPRGGRPVRLPIEHHVGLST
jgi:hypothetical protein